MKVELLIIILSLLYISTYQNENITLNITELTDESFSNYTKQYEFTLLFFHSKNCIPCRKAMSSLRRANYYLQSLNPPRAIALIDIESNSTKDIQSRFPNQPLPYLYLYSSKMDKVLPYSGLLTTRSIITYVLKNTGKNVNSLTSLEHIQSFINENITYMSVFNFKEGINEQFEELSRYYPYSLFANCFSEECKKYFNPKGDILILKQFEKEQSRIPFLTTIKWKIYVYLLRFRLWLNDVYIEYYIRHFMKNDYEMEYDPEVVFQELIKTNTSSYFVCSNT